MVAHVWNIVPICPNPLVPGATLSHTAILEGHQRKYQVLLQKKGGKKEAIGPKAKQG